MGTKKNKKVEPAKKNSTRVVVRADSKSTKAREPAPSSEASLAYNKRAGLTPDGIQIAHADGTPTDAFIKSQDEKATRAALAEEASKVVYGDYARSNGIHPVHDDLDRAEILKSVMPDPMRTFEALIDADARLRHFVQIGDATLAAFNADAVGEADTIRKYEDIPVWVKDMMGLLKDAMASNPDPEEFDVGVDPALVKALEERDAWKAQNAVNVEMANDRLKARDDMQVLLTRAFADRDTAVKERDAYVQQAANASRWEKEREAALQSARTHREAADAAIKELKAAQKQTDDALKETANLRVAFKAVESSISALQSTRDTDMDAAVTVARAFEIMVADTAAVLDLTACGPETQEAVARAMAIIEPTVQPETPEYGGGGTG